VRASEDFWLLVQHQSLALQQQMLPAMKAAADAGEASRRDYAYLFDRVAVNTGAAQYWGTQSHCENGRAVLFPVQAPRQLPARRRAAGLEPLADSLKASQDICRKLGSGTNGMGNAEGQHEDR